MSSEDCPTDDAPNATVPIHDGVSAGALMWCVLGGVLWVTAAFGWFMVLAGMAALFVSVPALRMGMEPVDTPWRVFHWLCHTLPVAGLGTTFVWLRVTGRIPPAWPPVPSDRPGPVGWRRLGWYFVAFPPAIGEVRAALTGMLRLAGAFLLVSVPFVRWTNRAYEIEGVRTAEVVVANRYRERRGETWFRVVELAYRDADGARHLGRAEFPVKGHGGRFPRIPNSVDPDSLGIGDRLPQIKYLASRPERFRFPGRSLSALQVLGLAAAAWCVAAFLVWTTDWFPSEARIDGGGP